MKKPAELWTGRGPFGALFFELHLEDEKISSSTHFAGTYQEICRDAGKKYAKEMLEKNYFEYVIINGKIPHAYPLPIQQADIDTLVTTIGKKFKLVKSD